MKKLSRPITSLMIAVLLVFLVAGCEDDPGQFALDMSFTAKVGDQDFFVDSIYEINTVKVSFERVQFYVSNIRLVTPEGTEVPFDEYLLVNPETPVYNIGQAEGGSYEKIRFDIGIDSITNHADPSVYALSHPLGAKTPAMHWSWNSGYIFLRIDGFQDTNGDDIPDAPFEAHLGTDNLLRSLEYDIDMNASDGDTKNIIIALQVDQLYNGVDMTGDITTHTMDNMPLAMTIAANIQTAFGLSQ